MAYLTETSSLHLEEKFVVIGCSIMWFFSNQLCTSYCAFVDWQNSASVTLLAIQGIASMLCNLMQLCKPTADT